MKTLTFPVLVASVLIMAAATPFGIQAAQRAITVDSLEKAYASRVTVLDAEIASTTKAMDARVKYLSDTCMPKQSFKCSGIGDQTWKELNKKKTDLEFEQRSLPAIHNLLQEALK